MVIADSIIILWENLVTSILGKFNYINCHRLRQEVTANYYFCD